MMYIERFTIKEFRLMFGSKTLLTGIIVPFFCFTFLCLPIVPTFLGSATDKLWVIMSNTMNITTFSRTVFSFPFMVFSPTREKFKFFSAIYTLSNFSLFTGSFSHISILTFCRTMFSPFVSNPTRWLGKLFSAIRTYQGNFFNSCGTLALPRTIFCSGNARWFNGERLITELTL